MTEPARRLTVVGEATHRDEAAGMLRLPGDAALVRRGPVRSLIIACPDGCGETLSINLDPRAGKAWRLRNRDGVTLFPSVWRDGGCDSHFVVWRDVILWCDRFEGGNREPPADPSLTSRVLDLLDLAEPQDAAGLAEALDETVWDVSRAANALVEIGLAEKSGPEGGVAFTRSAEARRG